MVKVIPAILSSNPHELEELLKRAEGVTDRVQIDIIDGQFAQNEAPLANASGIFSARFVGAKSAEAENSSHSSSGLRPRFSAKADKTIDPSVMENFDTDLLMDFHLMTKEPVDWVERCVRAGADRIIGQIEKMASQVDFVGKVSEVALSVGLAIDLETPVSSLDPTILTNLDVVLVMAVRAGFGGQKFEPKVLSKIKELDEIRSRDATPFKICVDGGETPDTMDDTRLAGADEVVIGRRLFDGDLAENINKYIKAAYKK